MKLLLVYRGNKKKLLSMCARNQNARNKKMADLQDQARQRLLKRKNSTPTPGFQQQRKMLDLRKNFQLNSSRSTSTSAPINISRKRQTPQPPQPDACRGIVPVGKAEATAASIIIPPFQAVSSVQAAGISRSADLDIDPTMTTFELGHRWDPDEWPAGLFGGADTEMRTGLFFQ